MFGESQNKNTRLVKETLALKAKLAMPGKKGLSSLWKQSWTEWRQNVSQNGVQHLNAIPVSCQRLIMHLGEGMKWSSYSASHQHELASQSSVK